MTQDKRGIMSNKVVGLGLGLGVSLVITIIAVIAAIAARPHIWVTLIALVLCWMLASFTYEAVRNKSEKSALNNPEAQQGIEDSYSARSKEDEIMHASDDDRAALLTNLTNLLCATKALDETAPQRLWTRPAGWEREDMLEAVEKLIELKLPDVCVHHSEPWYCDSCKMELENKIRIQKVRVRDAITAYRRAG